MSQSGLSRNFPGILFFTLDNAMPIMLDEPDAELNYLIDQVTLDFALEQEQEFLYEQWDVIWRMGCRICYAPKSWLTDKDYQGPFQDTVGEIYAEGLREYQVYCEGQLGHLSPEYRHKEQFLLQRFEDDDWD